MQSFRAGVALMKQCPYCGYSNYDAATMCRKCEGSLALQHGGTVYKTLWFGPLKARALRSKALSFLTLGLLIKVYWGGYGPWPVVDNPSLAQIRPWLEPLLIYGGAATYVVGWILNWI